ncbi:MAG: hypothetical protein WC346_05260 [Methanogenium sp.]|jgi:hypothetical protein
MGIQLTYELKIPDNKINSLIVNLLLRNIATTEALMATLPALNNSNIDNVKEIADAFVQVRNSGIINLIAELEKNFGE